ncbi:MAG TPA: DUF2079 domain-containing protein [Streptosporangiaceae bacterium]|nr:DUF2079 domain-containing protein [Streptosporangiaceae bacterium]
MGIRTTRQRPALGSPQDPGEQASHQTAHRVAVGALTALVAAAYCGFALVRYSTFQTSSYDLVIFDQAVRSYAHFMPGISIIKGVHNGFGPHFSVLGDHFSPIIAVLAPLYWLYNGPQTLLVAQAVLFALATPFLWVFTRRAFGGGQKATVAAYLVAAAYALSWPIASALAFDFHEVAFVPVLTAVALERLQAGRLRTALIALACLLLVKEDMGLFVAGIGLYLAVSRRVVSRQRLVAAALVVGGLLASFIAIYVLIPAFGGRSGYYWAYTDLGPNLTQAAGHLITHPLSSLRLLITPRVKLETMLWLVGAFCFLPLLSPISLAVVPLLLERMLGNVFPAWWVTSLQYNAYLVVILLCAAVDGAARLDRWLLARRALGAESEAAPDTAAGAASEPQAEQPAAARPAAAPGRWTVALGCAAALCAASLILLPRFSFGLALHPSFYHRTAAENAAAAADAVVPAGVTVQAVDNLGPQLSGRDTVLLWDGDGSTPPLGAPWVVANTRKLQFTFASVREQRQRVALLERSGYQVVFARGGYLVLHRRGPATDGVSSAKETQ